jgi:putative aminopeptidase FrvX
MERLQQLQEIEGVSGDEGRVADFVAATLAGVTDARVRRIGDNLIVSRGTPRVALFAHLDTVGFTLGYDNKLIRVGSPHTEGGEAIRSTIDGQTWRGTVAKDEDGTRLVGAAGAPPGSRWVYDAPLQREGDVITGAYLDNRAGVWNAMRVVERCADVAVAFTVGEEHSGRGAALCGRILSDELGIRQALISDITWHTEHVHRGRGAAVSLRDRLVPRQRFLDRVLQLAEASGVPYQREIESDGSSDGGVLERTGMPIDWCFVGAPQEHPHTPREVVQWSDLEKMVELYVYLVARL